MIKNISKRLANQKRLSIRGQLKDRENGFTLVELLITVVIIAILTAIAVPAYISVVTTSQDSAAKQNISSVLAAQDLYYSGSGTRVATDPVGVFADEVGLTASKLIKLDAATVDVKRSTDKTVAAVGVLSENGSGWVSSTTNPKPVSAGATVANATTLTAKMTALEAQVTAALTAP